MENPNKNKENQQLYLLHLGTSQEVVVSLVWSLLQLVLLPQVRSQVRVCALKSSIRGLSEVSKSCSLASSGSVAIMDSSHSEELLRDWGSNESSTSWSRDKTNHNGGALSSDFARNGVRKSDLVSPVSTTDRDDGQLGRDDGSANSSGDFLGALYSKSDVTVVISDGDKSLEASSLSSTKIDNYQYIQL